MKKQSLSFHLTLAGIQIATAAGLVYAKRAGLIDPETAVRSLMVMIGVVLAIYANFIPKFDTRRKQRITGWSFVIAALAYAAVWIFVPTDSAVFLSMLPLGIAFLVVLTTCLRSGAKAT